MHHLTCDICGKTLLTDESVRYQARIQVFAAYDPLEITADDLARDARAEIRALLDTLAGMDPQEVEDSVYKDMYFDLCMACQREYLRRPLPDLGSARAPQDSPS
ncbi:hypothetical protein HQ560_21885 [bacterium]|nr:hypothetical protein [bacterium]